MLVPSLTDWVSCLNLSVRGNGICTTRKPVTKLLIHIRGPYPSTWSNKNRG